MILKNILRIRYEKFRSILKKLTRSLWIKPIISSTHSPFPWIERPRPDAKNTEGAVRCPRSGEREKSFAFSPETSESFLTSTNHCLLTIVISCTVTHTVRSGSTSRHMCERIRGSKSRDAVHDREVKSNRRSQDVSSTRSGNTTSLRTATDFKPQQRSIPNQTDQTSRAAHTYVHRSRDDFAAS